MVNTATNRDPAVYDQPDRLDISCDGPPTMKTFGGRVHYCLGAHLAQSPARRSPERYSPGASPHRPGSVEANHRDFRPDHAAHRIRRRT